MISLASSYYAQKWKFWNSSEFSLVYIFNATSATNGQIQKHDKLWYLIWVVSFYQVQIQSLVNLKKKMKFLKAQVNYAFDGLFDLKWPQVIFDDLWWPLVTLKNWPLGGIVSHNLWPTASSSVIEAIRQNGSSSYWSKLERGEVLPSEFESGFCKELEEVAGRQCKTEGRDRRTRIK